MDDERYEGIEKRLGIGKKAEESMSHPYISIVPDGDYSRALHISDSDYDAINAALIYTMEDYDIYEGYTIGLGTWLETIAKCKEMLFADSFDSTYESLCGIDYNDYSVQNPGFVWWYNCEGFFVWTNRINYQKQLVEIEKWTDTIKNTCNEIIIRGI